MLRGIAVFRWGTWAWMAFAAFEHRDAFRHPFLAIALIGAAASLFVIAAAVDVIRFGVGVDGLGYANLLVVWLFAQQLGFFYGDGSLLRCSKRALVVTALGALGVLAALVAFGPYPASMVGLPGDKISNMSPPTICLAVLTVFEVAVVMLLRAPVVRFLQREHAWTVVVAGNGVIMTVFLWHLTAALLALAIGVATVLLSVGVFGIASTNFADMFANKPVDLAVVSLPPLMLAVGTVAGIALSKRAVRCARLPL
jgi:hypothetical protein